MATISEIPELVKAMYSLFGEKWGRRIGRAIIIFILLATTGAAITALGAGFHAVSDWLGSLKPPVTTLFITIASAVLLFIGFLGIGVGLGSLLGSLIRIGLALPIHRNINSLLEKTEVVLLKSNDQDLLVEFKTIQEQWNTSYLTRISKWVTPKRDKKR
jgi:hypothetical protein